MGRLIDADALKANINTAFWSEIEKIIDYAPTIEVPTWIPFEIRPTDDEEREYFKSDTVLVGTLPDDGDEILVSKGKYVWADTFESDELGAWLDSYGEIEEGMAWMPLPQPYKETDHE